ncbi:hypothetical protein [Pontibacter mucosus]|uniref:hypothetical protein n=1 Tax=Pontibacter mucosus TaxID=1649266 RepID=UPI000D381D5B|nr:hypothetical protein [Pontibacter mucosus]
MPKIEAVNLMKLIRPKIIGTLTIQKMMAGNLAVLNDIKNPPNKIVIPCRSAEHGEEIIAKIKESKPGEVIYI